MQILVKDVSQTLRMDRSGTFRCEHDNVIVEAPCCIGIDCDCMGIYKVFCPDCSNADVTDNQLLCMLGE